jgi:GAF domain-containing protein
MRNGEVFAVLDIDSAELATFDEVDKLWLERVAKVLGDGNAN